MMKHTIKVTLNESEYETLLKFCGGNKRKCSPVLKQCVVGYIKGLNLLIEQTEIQHANEEFAKLTGRLKKIGGEA